MEAFLAVVLKVLWYGLLFMLGFVMGLFIGCTTRLKDLEQDLRNDYEDELRRLRSLIREEGDGWKLGDNDFYK